MMQQPDHLPIRTDGGSTKNQAPKQAKNQQVGHSFAATAANTLGQTSFDALDYARISSIPATTADTRGQLPPAEIQATASDDFFSTSTEIDIPYGELDPYVDPAELMSNPMQSTSPVTENNSTSTTDATSATNLANQALERIQGFEQQLFENETEPVRMAPPAVEIIAAAPVDSVQEANHADVGEPPESNGADDHTASTPLAVPIVRQETGESIFDVRDFGDAAAGAPEPIPGAFEVDPELFDFQTIESEATSVPLNINSEMYVNPIEDEQIFIAGDGDVIEINGREGFDHIDLACFDVAWATFADQVINVDDQQGIAFQVRYQDIDYALFSNGVEVELNSSEENSTVEN